MIVGFSTLTSAQRGPRSKEGIGGRGAVSVRREERVCRKTKEKGEWVSERVESNSTFKGPSSDETQTDHMRQLMEQLSALLIKK
jgi:hypothetical protein